MKRIAILVFTICFSLFLGLVALGTLLRAGVGTSFFENRTLAEPPALSRAGLWTGDYFDQWETWFTDHALGRSTALKANTWLELRLLRLPVVGDVVVTEDCLLGRNGFNRWDTGYLPSWSADWAAMLADLGDYIGEWGGELLFVGLPEQTTYFLDKYPDYLENRAWYLEPERKAVFAAMEAAGVSALDMSAVFAAQGRPEDYYARSDHHFTYAGALATREAILDKLAEDFALDLPRPAIRRETLPNPFLGSRNRKLSGLWPSEDRLEIGYADVPFRRWDNGAEVEATLYDLPASPEETVTYEVYMGGDKGETILRTDRPELPSALIFGDSFTNALETMLYASFDETRSLDLRYYNKMSLREYLDIFRPEVVIYVRDETTYFSYEGNGAVGD